MWKKVGILTIGIILILEAIIIPCTTFNKAKTNIAKDTVAEENISSPTEQTSDFSAKDTSSDTTQKGTVPTNNTDIKDNSAISLKTKKKAKRIYKRNKKTLVLVNAKYALKQSYQANLRTICNGRLYASSYLYDALVEMLADAKKEGFSYWIASAWRSREKQQKLIDEDVKNAMRRGLSYEEALLETYKETMPAGHSEHESGLALDILCSENTNMDLSQAQGAGNIWLRENCFHYGFILRYPSDKEDITGVHYEPWHLRYIGKEAAAFLKKHDLTLEEYWQLL